MEKLYKLSCVVADGERLKDVAYSHDIQKLCGLAVTAKKFYIESDPKSSVKRHSDESEYPTWYISEVPFII